MLEVSRSILPGVVASRACICCMPTNQQSVTYKIPPFLLFEEWKNDKMDGEGSLNVEHCRKDITLKANRRKINTRKIKNLDVRFEEGSLCSSCSKVEPKRRHGGNRKKTAVPGNVGLGEEGSVRNEMISLYSSRTNDIATA